MATITKTFSARKGSGISDDVASDVMAELEANGLNEECTPAELVTAAAKRKRSTLHSLIEWDDETAGDAYRLHQARNILNSIEVEVIHSDASKETTRFFQNVRVEIDESSVRKYVSIKSIGVRPDLSEQVIADANRELKAWRQKYRQYKRILGELWEDVNGLLE